MMLLSKYTFHKFDKTILSETFSLWKSSPPPSSRARSCWHCKYQYIIMSTLLNLYLNLLKLTYHIIWYFIFGRKIILRPASHSNFPESHIFLLAGPPLIVFYTFKILNDLHTGKYNSIRRCCNIQTYVILSNTV